MPAESPTMTLLADGRINSPYLICVRADGALSDSTLLQLFGLLDYERVDPALEHRRRAVLADGGGWTVLADDWNYTLWHKPETRPTIASLGASWDVFTGSVGEGDHSFDFVYYHGGRLVRRYVVNHPYFWYPTVEADEGAPLPGEADMDCDDREMRRVLCIAESLDIPSTYDAEAVRVYAPHGGSLSKR